MSRSLPAFSVRLRELRSRYSLTQQDLADTLGVDLSTIKRWEAGRFLPSQLAMEGAAMRLDRLSAYRFDQ